MLVKFFPPWRPLPGVRRPGDSAPNPGPGLRHEGEPPLDPTARGLVSPDCCSKEPIDLSPQSPHDWRPLRVLTGLGGRSVRLRKGRLLPLGLCRLWVGEGEQGEGPEGGGGGEGEVARDVLAE